MKFGPVRLHILVGYQQRGLRNIQGDWIIQLGFPSARLPSRPIACVLAVKVTAGILEDRLDLRDIHVLEHLVHGALAAQRVRRLMDVLAASSLSFLSVSMVPAGGYGESCCWSGAASKRVRFNVVG